MMTVTRLLRPLTTRSSGGGMCSQQLSIRHIHTPKLRVIRRENCWGAYGAGVYANNVAVDTQIRCKNTVATEDIKRLRQATGAPMMDCKRALQDEDVQGNFDKALEWLRKKGMAKAEKKIGRTAADGVIGVSVASDRKAAVLAEVNSETDFVAKNPVFQDFVSKLLNTAMLEDTQELSELEEKTLQGGDTQGLECTVAEGVKEVIGKVGENVVVRRLRKVAVSQGVTAKYVHNALGTDLGNIVAVTAFEIPGFDDLDSATQNRLEEAARKVCMHVAAAQPRFISPETVPQTTVEQEKDIIREQVKRMNKPDNVVEKIVEGRLRKFYSEACLLQQEFVVGEGEGMTVGEWLEKVAKECEIPKISISDYGLLICGEHS